MSAAEVAERIGPPGRVNLVQGDDCWQRHHYPGTSLSLFLRCRVAGRRHRAATHRSELRLATITVRVGDGGMPRRGHPRLPVLPAPIAPAPGPAPTSAMSGVRAQAPERVRAWALEDLRRALTDRGIEVTGHDGQWLSRVLDHAHVQAHAPDGRVSRIEADLRGPVGAC